MTKDTSLDISLRENTNLNIEISCNSCDSVVPYVLSSILKT